MGAPTAQELRTRAERRADMVGATFVSDAEWLDYINVYASALYDIILTSDETALVKSAPDISVIATQDTYALPIDFYKVNAMFELQGTNNLLAMDRLTAHELSTYWDGYGNWYPINGQSRYRYYIEGLQFIIRPMIAANFTIKLKYVPQFQRLTTDISPLSYPCVNGWEEYVVIGAAIAALTKEGTNTDGLKMELAQMAARIQKMTTSKDQFSPRQVRDIYGITGGRFGFSGPWGGW